MFNIKTMLMPTDDSAVELSCEEGISFLRLADYVGSPEGTSVQLSIKDLRDLKNMVEAVLDCALLSIADIQDDY